jgi:hypothetical protein
VAPVAAVVSAVFTHCKNKTDISDSCERKFSNDYPEVFILKQKIKMPFPYYFLF